MLSAQQTRQPATLQASGSDPGAFLVVSGDIYGRAGPARPLLSRFPDVQGEARRGSERPPSWAGLPSARAQERPEDHSSGPDSYSLLATPRHLVRKA